MADYESVFVSRTEDVDLELQVEGTLPPSLKGTFYGIGGSGTQVGSSHLHLFDAHGRVFAVRLGEGKAQLRARMVKTPLWERERKADAIVKRRLFTNKPSRWSNFFDVDLGNSGGHDVVPWGAQLVAANDPGFFVLDPVTLETRGPAPLAPAKGATFGPMPRLDPATGRHVLFEARPGRRDTLVVRELDGDFGVASEQTYKLDRGAALFHDLAFTERYYLVIQIASVSLPSFLWGAVPVVDALRFEATATPRLHLLPRSGGAPISVPLPGGRGHTHFWNAFETDGKIVVDAIGYSPGKFGFGLLTPPAGRRPGPAPSATPTPLSWRYTIDPSSRSVAEEQLSEVPAEAPAIHPERRGRPYRYGWAPAPGVAGDEEDRGAFVWYHALARHDFQSRSAQVWDAGPRAYVSPAAFVPSAGAGEEDQGHVLSIIQDAGTGSTTLGIFDARDLSAGPIARLSGPGLLGAITHVAFA